MKVASCLIGASLLAAGILEASVTMLFGAEILRQSDGIQPLPDGSLVLVMVDSDQDGFSATDLRAFLNTSPSAGDVIGGDYVIATGVTVGGYFEAAVTAFELGTGGVTSGDSIAFVWFSGVEFGGGISAGTEYGFFTSSIPQGELGEYAPLIVPADGATVNIYYNDNGGVATPADFTANLTVIPEPGSLALGVIGGLFLLRRRR